jgi:sugar (pentulose or hexulose) kinase
LPFGQLSRAIPLSPGLDDVVVQAVGAGTVRTVVLLDFVGSHVTWRVVPERN